MNKYRCIFAGCAAQQIDVKAVNSDEARKQAMKHFKSNKDYYIKVIFMGSDNFK